MVTLTVSGWAPILHLLPILIHIKLNFSSKHVPLWTEIKMQVGSLFPTLSVSFYPKSVLQQAGPLPSQPKIVTISSFKENESKVGLYSRTSCKMIPIGTKLMLCVPQWDKYLEICSKTKPTDTKSRTSSPIKFICLVQTKGCSLSALRKHLWIVPNSSLQIYPTCKTLLTLISLNRSH